MFKVKGEGHSVRTCAKIRKQITISLADCSISLNFRTDFDHVTLDVPHTVKVKACHNVSASKTL